MDCNYPLQTVRRGSDLAGVPERGSGLSVVSPFQQSYAVILADPPWRYRVWKEDRGRRTAESFYPTMSLQDLADMRPRIDRWAAMDCALFVWATPPTIYEYAFPS